MGKRTGLVVGAIWVAARAGAQVVIGEAGCFGGVADAVGDDVDWLELRNTSGAPVALAGHWLSDSPTDWAKWPFPANTPPLEPGERRLVRASGKGTVVQWDLAVHDGQEFRYRTGTPEAAWRRPEFDAGAWSVGVGSVGAGDGDDATVVPGGTAAVYMRRAFEVVDPEEVAYALLAVDADDAFIAYLNGREIGRSENLTWAAPGVGEVVPAWAAEAVLYAGGVPEVRALDLGPWLVPGENVFALEVHNAVGSEDLTARPFLALGTTVPGEHTPLPDWLEPPGVELHTNFKLQAGETVALSGPNGVPVDALVLPEGLRLGLSFGRAASNPGAVCVFDAPTPGAPNAGTCYAGIAPVPVVSPASGRYPGVAPVVEGEGVRISVDGTEPGLASPSVVPPIGGTTVLHARAFIDGLVPSDVVTRTYLIGEAEPELPVISISTDPANLWDWETGIYVLGPGAQPDYPFLGANFWQPWSRRSRYTWFDAEGTAVDAGELDLEIHGGWSRGEPQKSFRLDFKNRYSGDLEAEVFAERPGLGAFGNLNLRNGGQGSWTNKMQDGFLANLALTDLRMPASAWQPVEVWLNGEYWGVYGAREKTDERWIADVYGIPEEHVDLLNQWEPLAGPPSAFDVDVAPLLALDAASDAFEEGVRQTFDVPAFIDYHALQIHGGNVDWMSADWGVKNMKYFRDGRLGGPWRYVLFDLDACFGDWATPPNFNALERALNPPYPSVHSDLLGAFLEHGELRCAFVTRYSDLLNSVFEPAAFEARLLAASEELAPVMPRHVERWGSPVSVGYWWERVQHIAGHNAARVGPSRDQLGSVLGLGAAHTVSTAWGPTGGGTVTVNGMPGAVPFWSGAYYGDCPIEVAALPAEGFGFTGWDANAHSAAGAVDLAMPFLSVSPVSSDLFRANFAPCLGGVDLLIGQEPNGTWVAEAVGLPAPGTIAWWQGGELVGEGPTHGPSDEEGPLHATLTVGECTLVFPVGVSGNPVEVAKEWGEERGRIWPNPANASFATSGISGPVRVVSLASGATTWQGIAPGMVHTADWANGVYLVHWQRRDGTPESARLVVVH